MKILVTFARRSSYSDSPEVVDAWDEYCVDANPEGFQQSRSDALAALGSDLKDWMTVQLEISDDDLDSLFQTKTFKVSLKEVTND